MVHIQNKWVNDKGWRPSLNLLNTWNNSLTMNLCSCIHVKKQEHQSYQNIIYILLTILLLLTIPTPFIISSLSSISLGLLISLLVWWMLRKHIYWQGGSGWGRILSIHILVNTQIFHLICNLVYDLVLCSRIIAPSMDISYSYGLNGSDPEQMGQQQRMKTFPKCRRHLECCFDSEPVYLQTDQTCKHIKATRKSYTSLEEILGLKWAS